MSSRQCNLIARFPRILEVRATFRQRGMRSLEFLDEGQNVLPGVVQLHVFPWFLIVLISRDAATCDVLYALKQWMSVRANAAFASFSKYICSSIAITDAGPRAATRTSTAARSSRACSRRATDQSSGASVIGG